MKTLVSYKLSRDVLSAIDMEVERTGKTKTATIEDAILFRRQFSEEAETAIKSFAERHGLPPRKVVEFCVLKAAGIARDLPFSHLAAV